MTCDPAIGAPPTLEWIAVERLAIDESYQRATDGPKSKRLIFSISKRWNWTLCQPLVVSRRADGSLFVIDGQHRLSGAIARGDIPHLPCVVLSGQDATEEASAFVALNTQRQKLGQSDIFNAMIAAGDETAKHVADLLVETGWRHTRFAQATAGTLSCGPMIVRAIKTDGECVVRNALTTIREAYPDKAIGKMSLLLRALFLVFRENRAATDPDALIAALSEVEPDDWELHSQDVRRANPALSRVEAAAEAIMEAYQTALRDAESLAA